MGWTPEIVSPRATVSPVFIGWEMLKEFRKTVDWIKEDFHSYPFRFCVETLCWVMNVSSSVILALTVPNPPLVFLYVIWIILCLMFTWAAWTRGSFGILANYLMLTLIDTVGIIRLLM